MTSKQQQFEEHITRQQASGLTQAAYCRKHKLNIKQFGYYLRRYRRQVPTQQFAEVVTADNEGSMTLEFPGGVTLRLSGNIDPLQLRRVCEALQC